MAKRKTEEKQTTAQRLSSIVKTCRNIMRKDKGMNGDIDRLPMLTWVMFLKFLDDMEQINETEATFNKETYKPIIVAPYRWRDWATNQSLTGDDLLSFVTNEKCVLPNGKEGLGLFYYLRSLQSENGSNRKDVVATIFKGINNRMINGYLFKDVVNKINEIHFTSSEEVFTLSHLYESLLKEMRDSAGDSGEFYTPRPVVRFMIKMINPQLGETVLDPAAGTGGFLVEAFEHLKKQATPETFHQLQHETIFGGEAKSLPYLLCQMNLLLHGMEYPQIDSGNSLRFKLNEIGDSQRVDIIVTNPPFGGEEEKGILNNFPNDKRTSETTLLFLQLIMRKLKRKKASNTGGRAAIVVPDGTLFADGVAARIKKQLLDDFNLHTIVKLPAGVFAPYTDIPINLIFFEHGKSTEEIWYYELFMPDDRKRYSKTKPLQYEELDQLKKWWNKRTENDNAWKVELNQIVKNAENGNLIVNLDSKNPNKKNELEYINPDSLISEIKEKEFLINNLINELNI